MRRTAGKTRKARQAALAQRREERERQRDEQRSERYGAGYQSGVYEREQPLACALVAVRIPRDSSRKGRTATSRVQTDLSADRYEMTGIGPERYGA